MALTVTTLINAATIAANTPSRAYSPAATALQAGSASVTLFGKVTAAGKEVSTSRIVVFFAVLPYDSTDGIEKQAEKCAERLELLWADNPGQASVSKSLPVPADGGYLHTWVEVPNLPYVATLTVTVVESPSTLVAN